MTPGKAASATDPSNWPPEPRTGEHSTSRLIPPLPRVMSAPRVSLLERHPSHLIAAIRAWRPQRARPAWPGGVPWPTPGHSCTLPLEGALPWACPRSGWGERGAIPGWDGLPTIRRCPPSGGHASVARPTGAPDASVAARRSLRRRPTTIAYCHCLTCPDPGSTPSAREFRRRVQVRRLQLTGGPWTIATARSMGNLSRGRRSHASSSLSTLSASPLRSSSLTQ